MTQTSKYFKTLCERESIIGVVVGLPVFNGQLTPHCFYILEFAEHLDVQLPCVMWDESGSTARAKAISGEMTGKTSGSYFSKRRDSLAAAVILQSYLNFHTFTHRQ
jgi:hypothetical protein